MKTNQIYSVQNAHNSIQLLSRDLIECLGFLSFISMVQRKFTKTIVVLISDDDRLSKWIVDHNSRRHELPVYPRIWTINNQMMQLFMQFQAVVVAIMSLTKLI